MSEPISAVEGTAIFYITPPGEPTSILHQESLLVQPGAYQLVSASGIGADLDLGLAADPETTYYESRSDIRDPWRTIDTCP